MLNDGATLYHKLCESNNFGVMKFAITQHFKAILKSQEDSEILHHTILQFCAEKNYPDLMKQLILEEGCDPNSCDKEGYPVLTSLLSLTDAIPNILSIVEILLQNGAKIILEGDSMEKSPLCYAASAGRLDILEKFKETYPQEFERDDIIQVIKEAIEQISIHILANLKDYAGEYDSVLTWLAKNFPVIEYFKEYDTSLPDSLLNTIFARIKEEQEQEAANNISQQDYAADTTLNDACILGDATDTKEEDFQ